MGCFHAALKPRQDCKLTFMGIYVVKHGWRQFRQAARIRALVYLHIYTLTRFLQIKLLAVGSLPRRPP